MDLFLQRKDIDINSVDWMGCTALLTAVEEGHEETVKLLLARAETDVNFMDANGETALSKAVRGRYANIVSILLQTDGIELNLRDNSGLTGGDLRCYWQQVMATKTSLRSFWLEKISMSI